MSDSAPLTMLEAKQKAAQLNCDLIQGDEHILTVDWDLVPDATSLKCLELLTIRYDLRELFRYPSRSGNGTHVVLYCPEGVSRVERLFIQMAVGSDRLRETLAFVQPECLSFLFRPKLVIVEPAKHDDIPL